MEYTVRWVIQVDADSPEGAAMQAAMMARDPDSEATTFDVVPMKDEHDPNAEWKSVEVPWL